MINWNTYRIQFIYKEPVAYTFVYILIVTRQIGPLGITPSSATAWRCSAEACPPCFWASPSSAGH